MIRLRRLAHAVDRAVEHALVGEQHYRSGYTLDALIAPYMSPTPTVPAGLRPWST